MVAPASAGQNPAYRPTHSLHPSLSRNGTGTEGREAPTPKDGRRVCADDPVATFEHIARPGILLRALP